MTPQDLFEKWFIKARDEPRRNDPASPGYRVDPGLYDMHAAAWRHAKQALEWYDRTQNR